jgi:16S rRNA (cytosine967-C5)-methyltransferase
MPVSIGRRIAFEVLRRVATEEAYASDLLYAKLRTGAGRADAALATELTLGTLRRQGLLDFLLQRELDAPIKNLDPEILIALRIGLYQLRFLDRIPARAAVNESVELAKLARKRSAAPLVNAVLRRTAAHAGAPAEQIAAWLPAGLSKSERLGILHSHPAWLVERWLAAYGEPRTLALLEANNCAPRLTCAVHDSNELDAVIAKLRARGLQVEAGRWLAAAISLSGGNAAETEIFKTGRISFQDEASQMVAMLVDGRPGQITLDLCAAPGGKTSILAAAVAPAGHVVAADLHLHRLRSAREQTARTHTEGISWLAIDATQPLPFARPFQRILLDAPCTGTGTLARNPEIRWRLRPADLIEAQKGQIAMLTRALAALAPGGRLVYATCSLEPEENEAVIERVRRENSGIRLVSGEPALQRHLQPGRQAGRLFGDHRFFRTFPPETGTDGFFAAILERSSGSE